ncbi:MAG: hypothetical protein Q8P67_09710, partial [archaeon]|nr:hypothetical protein [archaeon]
IQDILRHQSYNLIDLVRLATSEPSKMIHVRSSCRVLFSSLSSTDHWADFLNQYYARLTSLFADLEARGPLAQCVVDHLLHIAKNNREVARYVLPSSNISLFRERLIGYQASDRKEVALRIATLISAMCQSFISSEKAAPAADPFSSQPSSAQASPQAAAPPAATAHSLDHSVKEWQRLWAVIGTLKLSNEREYAIKASLLRGCRFLLKRPEVASVAIADEKFIATLLLYCKDGKHELFNAEAWSTFFQLIQYHPTTLSKLKAGGQLQSFLDIPGIGVKETLLLHGLKCMRKLLSLTDIENRKLLTNSINSRGEKSNKSVETDVRTVCEFMGKSSLFVKLHMIYRNMRSSDCPGKPFSELASIYFFISSSQYCEPLWKEVAKNADYKEGVRKIGAMYNHQNPRAINVISTASVASSTPIKSSSPQSLAVHQPTPSSPSSTTPTSAPTESEVSNPPASSEPTKRPKRGIRGFLTGKKDSKKKDSSAKSTKSGKEKKK